ncbi:MAG: hypothetical protein L0Z62_12475 [Gemmataceae bacterium]|nr:hypothetical protein [Gemmataceae bacterium]
MHALHAFLFLTGLYPLWLAWRANWHTTLLQAINWSAGAWLAWVGVAVLGLVGPEGARLATARYLALALAACAGVAVLGARRPGVGAWNFVLLALLAVLLLPVAEGLLLGRRGLDVPWFLLLAVLLAVSALNYLPTRLAPGALLVLVGGTWEVLALADAPLVPDRLTGDLRPGWLCVALAPWAGLAGWRGGRAPGSEFDALWLDFRNRFGFIWGYRVREQFNRAAVNAGWPVLLSWQGLLLLAGTGPPEPETQEEIMATLRALLRRFGPEEPSTPAP